VRSAECEVRKETCFTPHFAIRISHYPGKLISNSSIDGNKNTEERKINAGTGGLRKVKTDKPF
jgi:hypothetical protein